MKIFLTTFFLTILSVSQAGIGLGDWKCSTPGDNTIDNFSGRAISFKNGDRVEGLSRWFFYDNYIVGELVDRGYFVANEVTYQVDVFQDKNEWLRFQKEKDLSPVFWKRWFDSDWQAPYVDLGFFLFMTFYMSIPLILFALFILYKAIFIERLNFRKSYTILSTTIAGLILTHYLLGQFPQSI